MRSSTRGRRGENQYRKLRFARPHVAQHRDAVEFGKVQIENHEVVIEVRGHECALLPVQRYVHGIVLRFQSLANVGGQRRVVFNHQNPHSIELPS